MFVIMVNIVCFKVDLIHFQLALLAVVIEDNFGVLRIWLWLIAIVTLIVAVIDFDLHFRRQRLRFGLPRHRFWRFWNCYSNSGYPAIVDVVATGSHDLCHRKGAFTQFNGTGQSVFPCALSAALNANTSSGYIIESTTVIILINKIHMGSIIVPWVEMLRIHLLEFNFYSLLFVAATRHTSFCYRKSKQSLCRVFHQDTLYLFCSITYCQNRRSKGIIQQGTGHLRLVRIIGCCCIWVINGDMEGVAVNRKSIAATICYIKLRKNIVFIHQIQAGFRYQVGIVTSIQLNFIFSHEGRNLETGKHIRFDTLVGTAKPVIIDHIVTGVSGTTCPSMGEIHCIDLSQYDLPNEDLRTDMFFCIGAITTIEHSLSHSLSFSS